MKFLLILISMAICFNAQAGYPQVELKTSRGDILLELYPDKAPKTVENFINYVKSGFYKGTVFHRVVDRFVIQGGGFTPDLHAKPTLASIPNEATNGLKNEPGTLAMARTNDPDSATSQFFINVERNLFLNHYKKEPNYYGYAVFGKVIKGMDIVQNISSSPTSASGQFASDVPVQPIVIEDVTLVTEKIAEQPVKKQTISNSKKKRKAHG